MKGEDLQVDWKYISDVESTGLSEWLNIGDEEDVRIKDAPPVSGFWLSKWIHNTTIYQERENRGTGGRWGGGEIRS